MTSSLSFRSSLLAALLTALVCAPLGAQSLLLRYSADDTSGSTVTDTSGNGYTARLTGSMSINAPYSGKPAKAFDNSKSSMAGAGGSVRYEGKIKQPVTSFSVTLWYQVGLGEILKSGTSLFDFTGVGDKPLQLLAPNSTGHIAFTYGGKTIAVNPRSTFTIFRQEEWVFIAFVYDCLSDQDNVRVYVGSEQEEIRLLALGTTDQKLWQANADTVKLAFGANSSNQQALSGFLADIRIYADNTPERISALDPVQLERIRNEFISTLSR